MRQYTISKRTHVVYDDVSELPKDLKYLEDWRKADVGDWVLSDDGCVIQVLRIGHFARPKRRSNN